MKIFNIALVVFLAIQFGVYAQEKKQVDATIYGEAFEVTQDLKTNNTVYQKLKTSETSNIMLTGKVTDVCKMKGCWMKVELEDETEIMVRFKDYGFFVPKDATGKTTVVNGVAFVEEVSVAQQKHYAEDAGKSEEEIAKITKPVLKYSFEAEGVFLKE